jgi:hypothetical protein
VVWPVEVWPVEVWASGAWAVEVWAVEVWAVEVWAVGVAETEARSFVPMSPRRSIKSSVGCKGTLSVGEVVVVGTERE